MTICAYFMNIDHLAYVMSPAMMEGFNVGVGFTIAANQIPYGMGLMDSGMHKHRHLYNNLYEFWVNLPNADPFQTCLTLTGAAGLVALNKWKPKYVTPLPLIR
jgi:MFS superfamily sulfate permease-like transporter